MIRSQRKQLSAHNILDAVHFSILRVGGGDQEVVGDIVEMTTELEPGSSGGDVIGRTFTFHLQDS